MLTTRLTLAGLLLGCAAIGAQARGPGGWGAADHVFASVPFTAAQQQQVDAIMQASRTQTAPLRAQMRSLAEQISALLLSPGNVTEVQLAPLVQQREAVRQQLDAQAVDDQLAVRALLSGAQLAQAASIQAQLSSLRDQEHAIRASAGSAQQR